jgi:hypothetical protein
MAASLNYIGEAFFHAIEAENGIDQNQQNDYG